MADPLLAGSATAPGLSVAGLRLTDGSPMLKLERGGAATQFRLEPGGGFDASDCVLAEPRGFVARLQATRELAVGEPPRRDGGRATVTC